MMSFQASCGVPSTALFGSLTLSQWTSQVSDIAIEVHRIEDQPRAGRSHPITRLELEWEAARSPRLFPLMKAELSVYPLTATETQLDFAGIYTPPLGPLGSAVNTLVGHRIAEACVHRFLTDVARFLRNHLQ